MPLAALTASKQAAMQSIIKRAIIELLSVNWVLCLFMTDDTEVDRQRPTHLLAVQRPGVLPGDGGESFYLPPLQGEETVEAFVRRFLADQRGPAKP